MSTQNLVRDQKHWLPASSYRYRECILGGIVVDLALRLCSAGPGGTEGCKHTVFETGVRLWGGLEQSASTDRF